MHKNSIKCNKTQSKWCKNKHGASKIIDTFETYHLREQFRQFDARLVRGFCGGVRGEGAIYRRLRLGRGARVLREGGEIGRWWCSRVRGRLVGMKGCLKGGAHLSAA
jgi:hypothetical protein